MTIFKDTQFNLTLDTPLYQQIYTHLRASILSGELKGGMKLPSTRTLADELGVSRNTTLNAYRQLIAEGYLDSVEGSGTFVARVLPDHLLTPPGRSDLPDIQPGRPQPPQFSAHARLQLEAPQMSGAVQSPAGVAPRPFRFGIPSLEAFPYKLWSRLVIRQARRMPASAFTYQNNAGYPPLREAIAAYATVARQVHCTPEQVVIVSGTQGGLDLAARMLIDDGDPVWMEDPGYLKARGAFLGAGARIIPVPVDREGLVVQAGLARAPQARLVYVTPSHQFPLGITMSLARRLALLEWARRTHAYILEDDYDSEYRFARRPLPALQALDDEDRVIYVGTFSKVLYPALRIGYLILPLAMVDAFQKVRSLVDTHPPILEQAVLTDFIAGGYLTRHLRRMRRLYAERRAALLEAARDLPLDIQPPETGIHCIGWLPKGMDDLALVRAAAAQGVDLTPVSNFSIEPLDRQGVILGYSEYSVQQIQAGVRKLAAALRSV